MPYRLDEMIKRAIRVMTPSSLPVAMRAALVAVFVFAGGGCGASRAQQPVKPPVAGSVAPTPVTNDQFGQALLSVLSDGSRSPARLSLLAGVVRRQFARASERFAAGQPERGLEAVKGALYLVREGELRLEMLDPAAASALDGAHKAVAPLGLEGDTLAFLRLQASALPKDHPDQGRIQQHLRALEAWMKDTRQRSDVENASADARAFGGRAMLEPTPESLEQARAMVDRWLDQSLEFNATFRPGMRDSSRDEMVEAYRALRTGAIIMAGLYLRHGDAAGAAKALERSEARKVASPELFERLQTAATLEDAGAWRDLAALYSDAVTEGDREELAMPPGIAEGAAWGAVLAAFRADPTQLSVAGPLSMLLARYGMPEGTPLVLTPVVRAKPEPETINTALRVVAGAMLHEDDAHDHASVQRVFAASQELLAIADAVHASKKLDPSPARIRGMMASLYVRSGNVAAARPMLEKTLQQEPSLHGYASLAALLFQSGDRAGALASAARGLAAPDAGDSPIGRADLQLLVFRIHRESGDEGKARTALAAALKDALDGRARAASDTAHAAADRVLARLAYYFGDRPAWQRAVNRMLLRASGNTQVVSMALIEATATGLLNGDVRTAHRALEETLGAAPDEDVVYAALWLQLAERAAKDTGDGMTKEAFEQIEPNAGWVYHLARYGLGQLDDAGLLKHASNLVERTEAEFYIAMRKRIAGDPSAQEKLTAIASGPAIELVETHIARELIHPKSGGAWGPAPSALP